MKFTVGGVVAEPFHFSTFAAYVLRSAIPVLQPCKTNNE